MSGAIDEDVVRTVDSGRETLGAMLGAAQKHLQKVFIVFVIGLMLTIYLLREVVWLKLQSDLNTNPNIEVIAVTPFDVILLQVKIGLVVGLLMALPLLIYYSRDALRERGLWPGERVPRWKLALIGTFSLLLFAGGVTYSYTLFFPLMFDFLAGNAVQGGFEPKYSIVKWAQFIFLLSVSFGLAAQLPLAMSGLSYTEIVPYEVFRDKWRYAVVGIFIFGALFSPPDPFTQIMWAVPLLFLYGASLLLSKFVVTARRSSEQVGVKTVVRSRWNVLLGAGLLGGVGAYALIRAVFTGRFDPYLTSIPAAYRPASLVRSTLFGGVPLDTALVVIAVAGALVAMLLAFVAVLLRALDEVDTTPGRPAPTGTPAGIDLAELDEGGVRAAPIEVFVEMTEEEALSLASNAMAADDPDKAQAILDRFDATQEMKAADPVEKGATASAANHVNEEGEVDLPADEAEEEGNVFARTGAGMLSAFSEDEIDEDDIGGYYYDFAFILESLTSRAFRIVGLFMLVLAGVFVALYRGAIGVIKNDFLRRLPDAVTADQVDIVTLHPVEALIFEIKVATIVAAVATLPLLLYYAWPALKERGFASGDRNVLVTWAGALFVGLIGGSLLGYSFVAPAIISWLAADVIQANMVISYQISNFGWLVFFTTVGVGLLVDIPVTMLLFHYSGLVPYETMRRHWRVVTLGVLSATALLSPKGVFTMFLLGIPVMAFYGLGLGLLWITTLGGRRGGGSARQPMN